MPIIYTYPQATPKAADLLIGTVVEEVTSANQTKGNPTRSFPISSIQTLFNEDVVSVVVPITATIWKTLASGTDLTLLVAPGAGKAYAVDKIILFVDAGSEAFNTSADPIINGPWTNTNNKIEKGSTVIASTTDVLYEINPNTDPNRNILQQNAALIIGANSGTTDEGNGILYFNITYKIVNTSSTMV